MVKDSLEELQLEININDDKINNTLITQMMNKITEIRNDIDELNKIQQELKEIQLNILIIISKKTHAQIQKQINDTIHQFTDKVQIIKNKLSLFKNTDIDNQINNLESELYKNENNIKQGNINDVQLIKHHQNANNCVEQLNILATYKRIEEHHYNTLIKIFMNVNDQYKIFQSEMQLKHRNLIASSMRVNDTEYK